MKDDHPRLVKRDEIGNKSISTALLTDGSAFETIVFDNGEEEFSIQETDRNQALANHVVAVMIEKGIIKL